MENQSLRQRVYDIFKDFFGEENVDLQDNYIIIHFPKVTVTNEHDRSIDITHLWVRVPVDTNGTICGVFEMIRSEFTLDQFRSGYSHSHIPFRDKHNYNIWADPCLGSGPIRGTIASLSREFSEDMWNLFCLELSKYVTVESLAGTPYMYLERVGAANTREETVDFPFRYNDGEISSEYNGIAAQFIPFILSKRPFNFNFVNGSYGIAMSDRNIFVTLSNLFIEFYNSLPEDSRPSKEYLFGINLLRRGKYIDNNFKYIINTGDIHISRYNDIIGEELFTFKGTPVLFNITDSNNIPVEEDPNMSIFLSKSFVVSIIDRILRTINNKYGQQITEESDFSGEEQEYV